MASKYRSLIASRSRFLLKSISNDKNSKIGFEPQTLREIMSSMTLGRSATRVSDPFVIRVPITSLAFTNDENASQILSENDLSEFVKKFETDSHLPSVMLAKKNKEDEKVLEFHLPVKDFVINCLKVTLNAKNLPRNDWYRNGIFPEEHPKNIIVEFSSPNVAKPFHVGHLRSTIIGNFVANIHEVVGHKVTRLNWLGDWGTQFGLLLAGIKKFGLKVEQLRNNNAIEQLYKVYVDANKESDGNPDFNLLSRETFADLERGNPELMEQWKLIRQFTIDELELTYERLGVRFDEYHGEAMYSEEHHSVMKQLKEAGIVVNSPDGRKVVLYDETETDPETCPKIVVEKSDGTSLYVTRDCAAAQDRKRKYEFDRMFYVVENGQSDHFKNLFFMIKKLGLTWHDDLTHVKFGRIQGMSSRKGNAVFLKDILDEAGDRMRDQQAVSKNTKIHSDEVADVLGITAVLVNDMKQRRGKNYEFSWEAALTSKGDSGIKLQYTHSRLCSLLNSKFFGMTEEQLRDELIIADCAGELREPLALNLVFQIAKMDEKVREAYVSLEPCVIVQYLFQLCNLTSKCLKDLPVKTADTKKQGVARLILFLCAKSCLSEGMLLLGLKPLNEM